MPHRVIKTIAGRRGSALTLFGFTFTPVALSQVISRPESRTVALQWLPEWFTLDILGWVFMVASLGALVCGLYSNRLPPRFLSIGYGLAVLPPSILAAVYFTGTCAESLRSGEFWWGGLLSFCLYAGYAALVYLISGWEEPRPSPPMTDGQRQLLGGEA